MILKEYNLSVRLPQEKTIDTGITLVQNDKDVYKLNVRIFDGVNEIDYSEVDSATITFLKRDNNVVQGNMAVEADHLSYTLGTNEIAAPGKLIATIQLLGANERLTTARFAFNVEKDLITEDAVKSTSEFAILQQLKNELEEIDVVDLTNQFNAHKADFMPHGVDNAGFHNSIYRGLFLGNEVTSEQYQAISNGTFDDMYIGDYWTINGINWRIAAFNYYRNTGDTLTPGNHVVIVPDESLYSHVMNDTATTDGGYTGSKMYTEGLEQAKTIINNAFSGHVVTFRAYLCNAVTDGEASAGAWVDSTVDLMNEIMVYGSVVNGAATYGQYNIGTEKSQLPLFILNPQSINTRYSYWLRDVASASFFAFVTNSGFASRGSASLSIAVRPRFIIS